jgi:hypothetical protein
MMPTTPLSRLLTKALIAITAAIFGAIIMLKYHWKGPKRVEETGTQTDPIESIDTFLRDFHRRRRDRRDHDSQ